MTDTSTETAWNLPGGTFDDNGLVHREVELVRLSGREEELLCGMSDAEPAILVSRLLSRCVRRIGTMQPVTPRMASRLLIADRQYLLLKLREVTFGDRVEGTLACPWPQCGAKVDIDFSTTAIPVKRCEAIEPTYRVELSPEAEVVDSEGVRHRTIEFRLANGEDQEVLGSVLAENPAMALTKLFERCIKGTETARDDLVARLSPEARMEIEQAMEARSPRVELEMDLSCPECGRGFTAPFDLQNFFFGELKTTRDLLYRQVHYLAYHYHWSEPDILDMPRDKRLTYIDILADEIEAMNNAG